MPIEPVATPIGPVAPDTRTRTDAHNLEVDEAAATNHLCGTQHLRTDRACRLPERHSGGCAFTLPEAKSPRTIECRPGGRAAASLASYQWMLKSASTRLLIAAA